MASWPLLYAQARCLCDIIIPTPEHYLPLLYVLGLKDRKEPVKRFNDHTVMGSIAMTSVMVG